MWYTALKNERDKVIGYQTHKGMCWTIYSDWFSSRTDIGSFIIKNEGKELAIISCKGVFPSKTLYRKFYCGNVKECMEVAVNWYHNTKDGDLLSWKGVSDVDQN